MYVKIFIFLCIIDRQIAFPWPHWGTQIEWKKKSEKQIVTYHIVKEENSGTTMHWQWLWGNRHSYAVGGCANCITSSEENSET